ncbi:hypothetical protein B9G55_14915 [Saccharibacillus sp. O16]|nr:hypothetical protein B9G55_14915 [Saccharibacillus sp. O16]
MTSNLGFKRSISRKLTALVLTFSVLVAPYATIGSFGINQAHAASNDGIIRPYVADPNAKEWIDLGQKFTDGQQNSLDIPNKVIQMYFTSTSGSTTPTDNIALDKFRDSDLIDSSIYKGERNLLENFNNQELYDGDGTQRPFFVIDSSDGSEFAFDGISLYNLGAMEAANSKLDITGFVNGTSTGRETVTVNGSSGYSVSMLTAADLPSAKFGNVDRVEISMNPSSVAANSSDGLYFGFNSISIKPQVSDTVNSVSVSPAASNVQQGSGQQLTATVSVTGSPSQAVTWTSSDLSGKVSVDSNGYVSVAADAAPQDYTITATSVADSSKKGTATVTVTAAPTYTIAPLSNQMLNTLTEGYGSGTQQPKTVTVTRTGTGTLSNVAATLNGSPFFEVSALSATTLNDSTPSATFTLKAKDGLATGTYTATVTVSASNMTDQTFTVTQVVQAAPTYTIAPLSNQMLNPLTEGYGSGTQQPKTVTVTRTGTGTLSNVAATLNGSPFFEVSALSATTLNDSTPSATFTLKAKDGLAAGIYTGTVTVSASNMTDQTFTVTQVVQAAPTYTIAPLSNQTLNPLTEGYGSGTQQPKTVTVTRTGTGTLSDVAATLNGSPFFEVSALSATTLNDSTPSATFTLKAKDGLAAGTYTAMVTVSASNMTDQTFTVTQVVRAAPTYTIAPLSNQTLNPLTEGYGSGTQQSKTVTVTRTGTGTLSNVSAALSGTQAASFEVSALSATTLNDSTPSATFTLKAKDGLAAGIYTATVTVSASNMTDQTFTVTQIVQAAPTYTIAPILNQILNPVVAGYPSGTQETKTITVTRTGTGTLSNVTAALSGAQAASFEVSALSATTLNDSTPSAAFTVKAKDGLAAGTYTATVTVSASNMTDQTFTVTQIVSAPGQAAAPSASPGGGAVAAGTLVTLSTVTSDSMIHYTTDGSEPTANSPVYMAPVAVNSAMTIKAIAVKEGLVSSPVLTASYTITVPNPSTPTPTPETPVTQTPAPPPAPATPIPSSPVPSTTSGVDVLVNGKVENAGTATTSTRGDQSVVTIAVDEQKLRQRLDAEGSGAVITIPVNQTSDVVVGELNGQMVKNMENKQAVVELRTNRATYTLPAQQIDIDEVSSQVGANAALQDIRVKIEISAVDAKTQQTVEQAASSGGFVNVAPALDFTVRATYGDRTVEVNQFKSYVKRTIAIPDGVDPNRITTGVVVDPDGTSRHVPTKVIQIDGRFYAEINSLTNSTYSIVWHPMTFADVTSGWAQTAVNDMGSRMVVNGFQDGSFRPNQDMTRAEFAEVMVRGLGLKPQTGKARFSDVQEGDWYNEAILTASQYGLIEGFEDGTFRPQDNITREQAMQIMAKAMKVSGLKQKLAAGDAAALLVPFADAAKVSAWAKNSVADNLQAGIVTGRGEKMLAPQAGITRAEVALMIRNLLDRSDLI